MSTLTLEMDDLIINGEEITLEKLNAICKKYGYKTTQEMIREKIRKLVENWQIDKKNNPQMEV